MFTMIVLAHAPVAVIIAQAYQYIFDRMMYDIYRRPTARHRKRFFLFRAARAPKAKQP
jgi:hypothetical protein